MNPHDDYGRVVQLLWPAAIAPKDPVVGRFIRWADGAPGDDCKSGVRAIVELQGGEVVVHPASRCKFTPSRDEYAMERIAFAQKRMEAAKAQAEACLAGRNSPLQRLGAWFRNLRGRG